MPEHTLPPRFSQFMCGFDWTCRAYHDDAWREQLFDSANMGTSIDETCNITPVGSQGEASTQVYSVPSNIHVTFLDASQRESVDVLAGEDTYQYLYNLGHSMSWPNRTQMGSLVGFSDTLA